MHLEATADLVLQAKSGDMEAMERLLFHAHTPVSYLCRKILQDEAAAHEQIREILQLIFRKLDSLSDPEQFEKWVYRITAARCTQQLTQLRWGSDQTARRPSRELDIADRELNEAETADAVQQMLDELPVDPRLCLILYCCSGMTSKAICQLTGFSMDTLHDNLIRGQTLIQQQLEHYMDLGTGFSGITSLEALLHTAMYQYAAPEEALPLVYSVLGKKIPVPPDPGKWVVRFLTAVAVILFVAFLGLCGVLALKFLNIL